MASKRISSSKRQDENGQQDHAKIKICYSLIEDCGVWNEQSTFQNGMMLVMGKVSTWKGTWSKPGKGTTTLPPQVL